MVKKHKFADGGPTKKLPFKDAPPGENRYDMGTEKSPFEGYGMGNKKQRANFAAEGVEQNVENARTDYEKYKLPSDPSAKDMIKKLRSGDEKAARTLHDAYDAADTSRYALERATKERIKAATPSISEAIRGYKKGGSVSSRGDGKAVRGRTKGRFV